MRNTKATLEPRPCFLRGCALCYAVVPNCFALAAASALVARSFVQTAKTRYTRVTLALYTYNASYVLATEILEGTRSAYGFTRGKIHGEERKHGTHKGRRWLHSCDGRCHEHICRPRDLPGLLPDSAPGTGDKLGCGVVECRLR
eukprot:9080234-Pyramimonas_sp.AAC.1